MRALHASLIIAMSLTAPASAYCPPAPVGTGGYASNVEMRALCQQGELAVGTEVRALQHQMDADFQAQLRFLRDQQRLRDLLAQPSTPFAPSLATPR